MATSTSSFIRMLSPTKIIRLAKHSQCGSVARMEASGIRSMMMSRRATSSLIAGRMAKAAQRHPSLQTRSHLLRKKSATPLEALVETTAAGSNSAKTSVVGKPSKEELRNLFIASSIPMIGFGFMDNFVMIQAGQYIDSTLGVTLGLATLTAAAAGQVVSDVSGVVFGGTLERLLSRWALVPPIALSSAQRQLPIARNVAMFGAVCGVVVGCTIGAVVGLFTTDVAQREREQRDQEITTILIELMRVHSRHWRLYLPKETLVFDDADVSETQQHRLDHHRGVGQLRPIEDDPLAQECLRASESSSKHENTLSAEHAEVLYIPVEGWAVLRCQAEDRREADQLARHLSILFEALLRSKS